MLQALVPMLRVPDVPAAVALVERDAANELCEWHVLDGWRHLGSVRDPARIAALLDNPEAPFTRDTYRILRSHLRRHPEMEIVEL